MGKSLRTLLVTGQALLNELDKNTLGTRDSILAEIRDYVGLRPPAVLYRTLVWGGHYQPR